MQLDGLLLKAIYYAEKYLLREIDTRRRMNYNNFVNGYFLKI